MKEDSAKILSAISSSSTVKEETNFAVAKAVNISFIPLANMVIFSAATFAVAATPTSAELHKHDSLEKHRTSQNNVMKHELMLIIYISAIQPATNLLNTTSYKKKSRNHLMRSSTNLFPGSSNFHIRVL